MTQPSLHATPRPRDVLLAQIRAVGIAIRWPAAAAAALLALLTLLLTRGLLGSGDVIVFHPEQLLLPGLVGLLLPVGVWWGEERFGAGFLWTLPVDRRQHALAKVCAGWVWLMAAVAFFTLWLLAIALLSGESLMAEESLRMMPTDMRSSMDSFPFTAPGALDPGALKTVRWRPEPLLWLTPFTAATGTYLLASALALGIRLRWVVATLLGLFLIGTVAEAADMEWLMLLPHRVLRPLFLGPYGFDTLLTARTEFLKVGTTLTSGESVVVWRGLPDVGQWAVATLLWLLVGLIAVWLAASRHREGRRS